MSALCVLKHVITSSITALVLNISIFSSYVTVTYVIEAMAAANAWSLSDEWKKKKKNVQEHRQITDNTLAVCQSVRHVDYTLRLIMSSW